MPRRPLHSWPAYVSQRRRWLLAEAANPLCTRRDPETGKALCRWCGAKLQGRRTSFCSGGRYRISREGVLMPGSGPWGCVEEWSLRTTPSYARHIVLGRDRGMCAGCGVDCLKLELQRGEKFDEHRARVPRAWIGSGGQTWEVDHVLALHLGGSGGLANLQTLCVPCHREKSAREARGRAA